MLGKAQTEEDYGYCDCKCESWEGRLPMRQDGNNTRGAQADWVVYPPGSMITFTRPTWTLPTCNRQARLVDAASRQTLPSYCQEPRIFGGGPVHTGGPHPMSRPLVCLPCKNFRSADIDWRREALRFGVCRHCRSWAVANMQPGENRCICPPAGNNTGGVNNNEARTRHLCRRHDTIYYNQVKIDAFTEIDIRRRMVRPRKRGNNWTRKKQTGGRVRQTPDARRALHKTVGGQPFSNNGPLWARGQNPDWQPYPRCFCGESVGPQGHVRTPANQDPNLPRPVTDQVRNCVGCNRFIRRW